MKEQENRGEMFIDRKCDKCGKNFVPAPYHQFKDGSKYYCKYTCYLHREKSQDTRTKAILMYDKSGDLIKEFESAKIATLYLAELGICTSMNALHRACHRPAKDFHGFIFKYKEREE